MENFISGVLGMIDPRKKFGGESTSEVRKMLGRLNCKYADCIFIRRRLSYCCKCWAAEAEIAGKNLQVII